MPSPRAQIPLALDETSAEPAYQQIARQLRQAIESGARAPGERLPAIRTLASDLGVHRDTVALAYESLGEAGFVEARVGAGRSVAPSRPRSSDSSPSRTFARAMRRTRRRSRSIV